MLWREGVICIHLDTDASIIHRHCIIQPGSLSAKLPGSGDSGHSAQVATFIIPLSSSSTLSSHSHPREDTVTFPSWQPLLCRVETVSSLSPVRSIYRYSKKWIIFKDLNGRLVLLFSLPLESWVMWQFYIWQAVSWPKQEKSWDMGQRIRSSLTHRKILSRISPDLSTKTQLCQYNPSQVKLNHHSFPNCCFQF